MRTLLPVTFSRCGIRLEASGEFNNRLIKIIDPSQEMDLDADSDEPNIGIPLNNDNGAKYKEKHGVASACSKYTISKIIGLDGILRLVFKIKEPY